VAEGGGLLIRFADFSYCRKTQEIPIIIGFLSKSRLAPSAPNDQTKRAGWAQKWAQSLATFADAARSGKT
jgi:hypothetical protein